jgi:hypothetical protein
MLVIVDSSAGQLPVTLMQPFPWVVRASIDIKLYLIFAILKSPRFQAEKEFSAALGRDQQRLLILSDVHWTLPPVN